MLACVDVCVCIAGRSAVDSPGSVLSYVMPFNGDSFEFPASSGSITRIRMSHDDTMLFASGADGALIVFEVGIKEMCWC